MAMQPTGGLRPVPYRGEDRRRIAVRIPSPFGWSYWVSAAVLLFVAFAVTFLLNVASGWRPEAQALGELLQVASFMVALAAGALAITRWYLTSDAPALWIGVTLVLYGAVRLGAAELVPLVVSSEPAISLTAWLRPAAQLVFVILLARAATVVPVSSIISGPRLVIASLGVLVAAAALMQWLPQVASVIDGAGTTGQRSYSETNAFGIMPVAHSALAAVFTWQGYRRRRWLFTWLGLMLFTMAAADLARVVAPPPIESGLLAKEILRLLGLLLVLNGATRELLYTYRDSSTRLAKSEYTAMTAQESIRAGQAAAEERAHEARSALAAIEGATRTLEHYRDRLPPETQQALSTAISGEIRRLQRLVSVEHAESEIAPFSIAESLAPIIASEQARGAAVHVDVPGDAVAVGRASSTEQVLQSLFDNARAYAPASPVWVRAEREGDWIVVRVEDQGPGVPADQREAIFRRGVRGDRALDVKGSGLGLYVAAQLMREQSGELWVDDRPGGGASFALSLPAASGAASSTPDLESQDAHEETDSRVARGLRTADRPH